MHIWIAANSSSGLFAYKNTLNFKWIATLLFSIQTCRNHHSNHFIQEEDVEADLEADLEADSEVEEEEVVEEVEEASIITISLDSLSIIQMLTTHQRQLNNVSQHTTYQVWLKILGNI